LRGVLAPEGQAALAEEVFVIQQQLIETGAGDIDQAQFGLAGACGGAAAFGDVLAAAARGLHHLVGRARALIDEPIAKGDGRIVDDRRDLETAQVPIAAAGPQSGLPVAGRQRGFGWRELGALGLERRAGIHNSALSMPQG
jgi:hypothetical protein